MVTETREPILNSQYKFVEVFRRHAIFVATDNDVQFLKVVERGEPKPVFELSRTHYRNCEIAVEREGQAVIVSDGRRIYRISQDGDATLLAAIDDVELDSPDESLADRLKGSELPIGWFFAASASAPFLYFVLTLRPGHCVGRLDTQSKRLTTVDVPFPPGMDLDVADAIIYVPGHTREKQIVVKDFRGTPEKRIPVSGEYYQCRLSPDRQRLLLSDHAHKRHPRIAVVDLATGFETVLPVEGSLATWWDDTTLFFVRGANSLWRYEIGALYATALVTFPGQSESGYASEPTLSMDRTWLAWGYSAPTFSSLGLGTMLIDLNQKECRRLNGWWHNSQWLPGA